MRRQNFGGFTIIETVIVIAIITILSAIVVLGYTSFKKNSDLDNNVQEFVSALRSAQNKSVSSKDNSQYGVYINTGDDPNEYIIFKGSDYESRDPAFDQTKLLQNNAEFYDVNLGQGAPEIVFDRLSGSSEKFGSVSMRLKSDLNSHKTIYITDSGVISFTPPEDLLDSSRIKDTRHILVSYNRVIDTTNGIITLIFDDSQTVAIPISSFLEGDQLKWSEPTDVGGSEQIVKINTIRINSPDTVFSVFRDKRYNNKSLKIAVYGDSSGYFIEYSADGENVDHSSTYVTDISLQ